MVAPLLQDRNCTRHARVLERERRTAAGEARSSPRSDMAAEEVEHGVARTGS
jgi:hypothetical protein